MQRNWIELRPKNISFTSLSASASKSQNSLRRCNLFEVNGALHIQMEFIGGERLFSTVSFQGEEKILKATESENGPLFKSHSSTRLNSRRRWWSTFTDEALADNATLAPQLTYFLTLELAAQWVMQVLHKLNRTTSSVHGICSGTRCVWCKWVVTPRHLESHPGSPQCLLPSLSDLHSRHAKSVKYSTSTFFHPKNEHKKRVSPPILKFATKQRNLLITTSDSHLFVFF